MKYIAVERRGPHLWITFDRPDKLNVLHAEDLPGLLDTIVNLDPGVRGLVFTGAGTKAFSAGMNIEAFTRLDQASAKAFIGQLAQIMRAIREAPVVTVAAVSGYCLGGAFELALACDLRVVTTTAAFGLPEIKVGVPSVIDAALLPGFVGLSKAREMILTGDTYRLDQLPPHSIANVMELEILPDLNFLLPTILAIAKVATMVGLLGTVISMIGTFTAIEKASTSGGAQSHSSEIGSARWLLRASLARSTKRDVWRAIPASASA